MKALPLLLLLQLSSATLDRRTLNDFEKYMAGADAEMLERARQAGSRPRPGVPAEPVIAPWRENNPAEVFHGLIHDWLGAVFVPGATVEDALGVLRDVPHYPEIYSGDIVEARILSSSGNRRRVLFRVVKKKVITVVLETEYDVEDRFFAGGVAQMWSRSTRVAEVENAGKPDERVKPPDTGWGFLWRLNSYWHLEERSGGLLMECRAVSLTRDVPAALAWIIRPMVTSLPREALSGTLVKTRAEVARRAAARRPAGRLRPEAPPRASRAALFHAAPPRP
ncbi:MAG: hypothetical protein KatS3mg004_0505 [Bryobacteraceae bacterium]|nr:MAG: hypothetical protein KatS3mg004_0505 [Bryobacteraceae bacterium]